jgi:hypothetical protein
MWAESGQDEALGTRYGSGLGSKARPMRRQHRIVVRGDRGLRSMEAYLLAGERYKPVVALARSPDTDAPVLAYPQVRAVVGADTRVYLIPEEHLLRRLREVLGRRLALPAGAARIWWPGLRGDSDPGEHPLVLSLADEPERPMLAEFARQFHLSHPLVRREIELIEDLRALAEHELAQAREQNRSMKIERHEALTRAAAAEQALAIARQPQETAGSHDEHGAQ